MTEKITTEIDYYLKFKYNITPLNNDEQILIKNSKNNLLNLSIDKLEKTKNSLFFTLNGILETINKSNDQLTLSDFYLGSIYRDLYFGLSNNGVSTTPYIQTEKNSKITITYLKTVVNKVKNKVIKSSTFIELIDTLEEMKEEITVANTVYKK
jgi:hypothetical protein